MPHELPRIGRLEYLAFLHYTQLQTVGNSFGIRKHMDMVTQRLGKHSTRRWSSPLIGPLATCFSVQLMSG